MRKMLWLISLLLIVVLAGCGRQEEEQLPEEDHYHLRS